MNITRRISIVAAFTVAIMLVFSNVAYADEGLADAEPVAEATEENAETETVEDSADAEPVPEPVETSVPDITVEGSPVTEPKQPEAEVTPEQENTVTSKPVPVPEPEPAKPVKPAKSKFDNAVDRIKHGKDIRDLGIEESETDTLLSKLTEAGLIKSGDSVDFFIENGKVVLYEIAPESEEKSHKKTAKKGSAAGTKPSPSYTETTVSESNVPEVQMPQPQQSLPEEKGAEEPTLSFFSALVLLGATIKQILQILI